MSPRSLDPISRRPEKPADKPAGSQPVNPSRKADTARSIPNTADRDQMLAKAQANLRAKKDKQAKGRRKVILSVVLVALVAFILGGLWLFRENLPGNKYKDYAYVGGQNDDIKLSKQTADDLKKSLEKKAQDEKMQNYNATAETEKKIALWAGLKNEAQQTNVTCTSDEIQQMLRDTRKLTSTLDEYYKINSQQAGRTKEVVIMQDEIDCLQRKIGGSIVTKREYSALLTRWDFFKERNNNQTDVAAEEKISARLKKDYLPLYEQRLPKDEIAKKADDNYLLTPAQKKLVQQKYDGYQTLFRLYPDLLETRKVGGFAQYQGEGEDNYKYISQLKKAGDYTPVFKSSTGYYVIFRLETLEEHKYDSYDELIKSYQSSVKLSFAAKTQQFATTVFMSVRNSIVKVAKAAINCLTSDSHKIEYHVRFENAATGDAIDGIKLKAVTDRRNDICSPVDGAFAGDQNAASAGSFVGPNWHTQTVEDTIYANENVFGFMSDTFRLDCFGPSWRFIPDASTFPANYTWSAQPGSAYGCHEQIYFCSDLAITYGGALGTNYMDVDYDAGVNGDFFVLVIKLDYNPPALFNAIGGKYDRYGSSSGAWSAGNVRDDNVGDSSNAQPYNLPARSQAGNHWIVADALADWTPTGWRLQSNGTSGNGNSYGFAANTVPLNSTQILDFFYEPKPSTIQQRIRVKDPADGQIKDPCGRGDYLAAACNAQVSISPNFSLPGGLVNSYNSGTQTITGNGDATNLYANNTAQTQYRITLNAASIPTGFRLVETSYCAENQNEPCARTAVGGAPSTWVAGMSAWRYRQSYFILEPQTIQLRSVKRGPNINGGTGDTVDITGGRLLFDGAAYSNPGSTWGWTAVGYNNGNHTIRAEADAGWQIRGYAFCIGQAWVQNVNCTNDANQAPGPQDQSNSTLGNIITQGSGQTSLDLTMAYNAAAASFNSRGINAGQELFLVVYFKPAPLKLQARSVIQRESPQAAYNTDLNPCNVNPADYKYQDLCRNVDFRIVRSPMAGGTNADYVPNKPGYNYSLLNSHNTTAGGVGAAGASEWVKPGKKWSGNGTAIDDPTAQSENLVIFEGLYPGNYVTQYNNVTFPKNQLDGSKAYKLTVNNCADGTSNCYDTVAKRSPFGYCPLNFAQPQGGRYSYKDDQIPGDWRWYTKCVNSNGSPEGINGASSAPNPSQLTDYGPYGTYDPWPYWVQTGPNWWEGYWVDPGLQAANPNSQDYDYFTQDRNLTINMSNGYAESNFIWRPVPEIRNIDNTSCETISADIIYSPEPGRRVRTYITLDNIEVKNPDGSRLEVTTYVDPGDPSKQRAVFNIPDRQYGTEIVWKDGRRHDLKFWTIYEDPDLQQPFRESVSTSGVIPRYDPINPDDTTTPSSAKLPGARTGTYGYQCTNTATCDVSAFATNTNTFAVSDTNTTLNVEVEMTNTGKSHWWKDTVAAAPGETSIPPVSGDPPFEINTGHYLGAGTGMRLNTTSGPYGWAFTDQQLDTEPGATPAMKHIRPGEKRKFSFQVTTPTDGVDGSVLSFAMYQTGQGGGAPTNISTAPGVECSTTVRIRPKFAPWLRVQNGNVGALGNLIDQPEGARGTYKSTNTGSVTPNTNNEFDGTKEQALSMRRVVDYMQHAPFAVTAARENPAGSPTESGNFCSTNYYNFGRVSKTVDADRKPCYPISGFSLNLESSVKNDFVAAETGDQNSIYAAAKTNFERNGECVDTGQTGDTNGPNPLSPLKRFYRSWAPGSPTDSKNLVIRSTDMSDSPFNTPAQNAQGLVSLVNIINPGNDGNYQRPCPTIFKLESKPAGTPQELGDVKLVAGRATLVVEGDLKITGDIVNDTRPINGITYDYKQEADPAAVSNKIDIAGLNKLPNLGIVVNGDIIIGDNVREIQANLFSTKRILTCESYAFTGGIDSGTGDDAGGTTGTILIRPQNADPVSASAAANEPPAANSTAAKCSKPLIVRGSAAANYFALGRNFVDFDNIINQFKSATAQDRRPIFTDAGTTLPVSERKFCNKSTYPGVQRICRDTANNQRVDFDAPGTYIDGGGVERNYLRANGYPQSNYFGGPAEDFIGNGLSMILPPPGFENVASDQYIRPRFVQQNAKPRF